MHVLNPEGTAFAVTVLEQLLAARELNQTQLHHLSGVPQSHISKILSGQVQPTDEMLRKLFGALGLRLEDVLHETPTPDELVGYLATPLTGLTLQEEGHRDRAVDEIRRVASQEGFIKPPFRLYWPGDFTDPKRHPDFTPAQVYVTDRSPASAYDFVILFCASSSYGVGQEKGDSDASRVARHPPCAGPGLPHDAGLLH